MPTLPYFPLNVSDFQVETLDLDEQELGVYVKLILIAWHQPDGRLRAGESYLRAIFPNMHGHTFNRVVRKILARFFVLGEEGYENEMITNARQNASKRSAKAKQSIDKRWARVRENNDLADTNVILTKQNKTKEESKKESKNIINPDIRKESFTVVQEDLESWAQEFPLVRDILSRFLELRGWLSQFEPSMQRGKFVGWLANEQRRKEREPRDRVPLWQRDAYKQDVERERKERERLKTIAGGLQ